MSLVAGFTEVAGILAWMLFLTEQKKKSMKYVIVIPDGCADEPLEPLGGKTPLEAANLPAMDQLAASGRVGLANNTPHHLPAGS